MSGVNRGPVVQRQGFVKRAPSGKLSAFKKWEKKWCVFAISSRSGPVIDLFDDRSDMEKGPSAGTRILLSNTKQVCAAIQCKIPHTFIIVTDSKIVSLAALSQTDLEGWISCLRRVLAEKKCLLSSEEHEYEVSKIEPNRASTRRPPPPTPPNLSDDEQQEEDEITPTVVPTANSSFEPETLVPLTVSDNTSNHDQRTKLVDNKYPPTVPPPVPSTSRPNAGSPTTPQDDWPASMAPQVPARVDSEEQQPLPKAGTLSSRTENDFAPISKNYGPEALRNAMDVLNNYDDRDESYESGDRTVITEAHYRTLGNDVTLGNFYQIDEQMPGSVAPGGKPSSLVRASSARTESSTYSDNLRRVNSAFSKPRPIAAKRTSVLNRVEHDFCPQNSTVANDAVSPIMDYSPNKNSDPMGHNGTSQPLPLGADEESIYENSLTMKTGNKAVAIPAAAPRQRKVSAPALVGGGYRPVAAKRMVASKSQDQLDENSDYSSDYMNELGAFNIGVSTENPKSHVISSSSRPTNTKDGKILNSHTESAFQPEYQPIADEPDASKTHVSKEQRRAEVLPSNDKVSFRLGDQQSDSKAEKLLAVDIPIADDDAILLEDDNSNTQLPTPADRSSESPNSDIKNVLLQETSPNPRLLPNEEAPPPYTPPRLLNETQNSMELIAEGTSEDEELDSSPVILSKTVPSIAASTATNHIYEILENTSGPRRRKSNSYENCQPPVLPSNVKETNVDADLRNKSSSQRPSSPRTPPGTPPLSSKRYNQESVKETMVRLEDSFPRMPRMSSHASKSDYEEVVTMRPGSKPRMKKSFSFAPTSAKVKDEIERNERGKALSAEDLDKREYDHVIAKRKLALPDCTTGIASDHEAGTTSSAGNARADDVDSRKEKSQLPEKPPAMRRKSLPAPNTLLPMHLDLLKQNELQRSGSFKSRSKQQPLDGGLLMREGKIYKAPPRESASKNLPLKQAQMAALQEEIGHSAGVKVTAYRKDLKYVLFVDIMNGVWVGGWNQRERPLLQNILHVGDKILTVNKFPIVSASKLWKMIKRADSDTKFEVLVRRLPFGKAYHVRKNLDYEEIGMKISDSRPEVVSVAKGGLVSKLGLRLNPNKAFGPGQCHWHLTEVNHRPLSLISTGSDAESRLAAVGKDVTFVVQPLDFVELLKKELKSEFGWRDYLVS